MTDATTISLEPENFSYSKIKIAVVKRNIGVNPKLDTLNESITKPKINAAIYPGNLFTNKRIIDASRKTKGKLKTVVSRRTARKQINSNIKKSFAFVTFEKLQIHQLILDIREPALLQHFEKEMFRFLKLR